MGTISEYECRRTQGGDAGLKDQLMIAIKIAVDAHDGQLDKIGMPYILHPFAVMDAFELHELEERIVAVLHDILEDTLVTVTDLLRVGIHPDLVTAVLAVTKQKGEELTAYYKRVRANPMALRVKYRDIEHNLSHRRQKYLPLRDQIRLKEKYRIALKELSKDDAVRIEAKADPHGAGNGIYQCEKCGRNILSDKGWCVRCRK